MNIARKAALLNLILFPGWGQIYLKSYKKGIAIIIAVLAGILSLLWSIIQTTIAILKISPLKKGSVTFEAVIKVTVDSIKAMDLYYLAVILSSIILILILSVIDAYMTGKKQQSVIQGLENETPSDPESSSPGA